MRYKQKNNRKKEKSSNKSKIIILCTSIVLIVIVGSAMMAQKFFTNTDIVQAKDNTNDKSNEKENNGENVDNKKSDKDEDTNNQNNLEDEDNSDIPYDTPIFVQKYLDEQMRGEMPEGADGVKAVYLTFDDGPSKTVTPKVLDVLKEENVHATFFVVGNAVDANDTSKELLKRTVEEGNTIGIHSYSHDYHYLYPNRTVNVEHFKAEVEKTDRCLKNVLGENFSTKAIRLPGGHMSWRGTKPLDEYFEENGYGYIDWNSLSKDAEGPKKNAEQLAQEAIKASGTKEKVVLLMHDTYGKEETAKSLPKIIQHFKDNGYEFRVIK